MSVDSSHVRKRRVGAPAHDAARRPVTPPRPFVAVRPGDLDRRASAPARTRLAGWQLLLGVDSVGMAGVTVLLGRTVSVVLLATVAVVLAFYLLGLYRPRLTRSALDDLPRIVGGALIAAAATVLTLGETAGRGAVLRELGVVVLGAGAIALARLVVYALIVRWRRGRVARRTLVLGAGHVGAHLGRSMAADPGLGLRLVGYLDDDPLLGAEELGAPVLGGMENLARTILEQGVTDVFVAFGTVRGSSMVDILRTCDRLSCEIYLVPRLFELHAVTRDTDEVNGLPVIRAHRAAYRSWSWTLKRAVDIVASATALVIVAPVLAVCAVAVRWETGPGVFFRQTRVGLDGREFEIIKFRSLRPTSADESQTRWNISIDSRVGPVGKLLRRTSLDELPQLLNVLRGDMSLVGPRPERPHFVDQFQAAYPSYTARSRVPAGLTGLAAVNGLRGDTSIEERARFDNVYIENWSLWLDVKVLLRTALAVLRRTGG